MKILIYNGIKFGFGIGGGEKYALFLAKALEDYGEVTFIYSGNYEFRNIERDLGINLNKVKFVRLKDYSFQKSFFIYDHLLNDYLRKKKAKTISRLSESFDIFIANGHDSNHFQVKPRSKKNVVLCHSINKLTDLVDYDTKINKKSFLGKMYYQPYEQISKSFFSPLANFHIRDYDILISNSDYIKERMKSFWDEDAEILYPPVELNNQKRKKEDLIVSISRLESRKKLIEMVKAFKSSMLSSEWKYYIIVPRPSLDFEKEYLQNLQKEIQNSSGICILQGLSTKKIQGILSSAKIFWNLSGLNSIPEMFGMVNTEAMAHGCVPIIYNSGGHKEIVQNGKNGFLVNSTEELIERTLKVVNDDKLREKMSFEALERAKHFSFERFRDRLLNILSLNKA